MRKPAPARSQMEQKVPFGPSWARAKWDFLLHLERRPDPGAAAGHRPPAPADSAVEEAGGAHRRSLRRPGSAPPHRAAGTARIWVPRTKRGPPFGGPLGRSGGEARIRTGGKGFAGLCLTTWPLRRKRTVKNGPEMQWSGQRGSNPRPQPWQGCALPTEPCPLAGY